MLEGILCDHGKDAISFQKGQMSDLHQAKKTRRVLKLGKIVVNHFWGKKITEWIIKLIKLMFNREIKSINTQIWRELRE